MTTLLERIRRDALAARRSQDPQSALYTTLIGEADSAAKRLSPARDLTDEEVVALVKKFIKNLDETIEHVSERQPERAMEFSQQRNALMSYVPQQLTPEKIAEFARSRRDEGEDLGKIMAGLKREFPGQYDGKMASQAVREVLAEASRPEPGV